MPYIPQEYRRRAAEKPSNSGELNYAITRILNGYLEYCAREDGGSSYTHFNDCLGALEGAKLELQRRVIAPYEDTKMQLNGDVYGS